MAITKIADVIIPTPFTDTVMEPSIFLSRFVQSNAVGMLPALTNFLNGGGTKLTGKFWQDLESTESEIPQEGTDVTIGNITQAEQTAIRLDRVKAWGANALSSVLSGDEPLQAISSRVSGYWVQDYDKTLINIIEGIRLDNVANDAADLQAGTGVEVLSTDLVVEAQGLLGENGGADAFAIMAVHPKVRDFLRKADALETIKESVNDLAIDFYMGMELIVDRNLPEPETGKFVSYLIKRNAIGFGQSSTGYEPTEIESVPRSGMGGEVLHTRRDYCFHPQGFSFIGDVAGEAPTNAELSAVDAWDRVFEQENSGVVFIYAALA